MLQIITANKQQMHGIWIPSHIHTWKRRWWFQQVLALKAPLWGILGVLIYLNLIINTAISSLSTTAIAIAITNYHPLFQSTKEYFMSAPSSSSSVCHLPTCSLYNIFSFVFVSTPREKPHTRIDI